MANLKRDWLVPPDLYERLRDGTAGPVDRQAAINAFAECEAITNNLGGNIVVSSHTLRDEFDRPVVVGYLFRYQAFVKGRDSEDETVAEPELVEAA